MSPTSMLHHQHVNKILNFQSILVTNIHFQEVSLELNTAKIHLSSSEIEYILENISNPLLSITKNETCKPVKNIFFLKSSKTGGTTVMSILQRYGMRNDLDFLMGENHGGMYHNNRPFNLGTIKIYDIKFLYLRW